MRQRNLSSFESDSRMPYSLKQRQIELPMLEFSVEKALSSPKWREIVVAAMLENVEKGPGHLSVHRAKQALKQIASAIGIRNLTDLLNSHDPIQCHQAAHLLGWLKNPRAARPLLQALDNKHASSAAIMEVMQTHYFEYNVERSNV